MRSDATLNVAGVRRTPAEREPGLIPQAGGCSGAAPTCFEARTGSDNELAQSASHAHHPYINVRQRRKPARNLTATDRNCRVRQHLRARVTNARTDKSKRSGPFPRHERLGLPSPAGEHRVRRHLVENLLTAIRHEVDVQLPLASVSPGPVARRVEAPDSMDPLAVIAEDELTAVRLLVHGP